MVKIDILKFKGHEAITVGCAVRVKAFCFYRAEVNDNNFSLRVNEASAYEIDFTTPDGGRFKTWTQPHTPRQPSGARVKMCSVYGEVVAVDEGVISLTNVQLHL